MSQNLEVGVKITADSKGLVAESRAAQDAIKNIGETVKGTNAESAVAAERFTANLKRQADTLGMTASQVRAYDAAQMGLNEAQRASAEASNRAITAYENQQVALDEMKNRAVAAGAVIGTALVAGFKQSITVAAQAEQSHLRLAAVIRGTGHAAGLTKGDLDEMAEGMKEKLGIDDDALRDSMAVLLTFRNVSRDSFEEALEVSADLAAVMQSDLKSAVLQLGKALENPEEGLTALKRSGVSFSETQKDMIKDMVDAGDQAQAITLILKTMKEQGLDSVAESMNEGLTKSTRDAGMAWDDLLKTIGGTDTVKGTVDTVLGSWTGYLKDMRQVIESGDWLDRLAFFTIGLKTPDMIALSNAPATRADDPQARAIADAGLARQKEAQQAEIAAIAKKKADEEAAKAAEEASKRAIAAATAKAEADKRAAQQAVDSSNRIIAALKLETEQIGLNSTQKRMMSAAAEAAKAPTKELAAEIMASAAAWGYAAQQQENLQVAEKERIEGLKAIERAEKEAARASEEAARKSAAEWNQLWGGVETTAKTAFIQFAAHGKSAMESIGESIKIAILDVLYQLTIRKWVINIGASLSGFGGIGAANAAVDGGVSALNMASMASSGFGLLKSGFGVPSLLSGMGSYLPGSAGSFFAGMGVSGTQAAAQAGASALWGASGAGTAASMGASFASIAGPAIAVAAVDQIVRMLAGDKLIGGGVGKVLNYVPVLGPLLNGLFGRGPMKQQGTALTGEIGAEGFESGYLQTRFKAKGGLFRSDKIDYARIDAMTGEVWTDNNKLLDFANDLSETGKELFGLINDTTKQTSSSLRQIGQDLGVSTEGIDGFRHSINLLSEKGQMLTEEQIGQEIEKITDGLAHSLLPQVDELAKRGETALQTVSRLGTEFTALVDAATLILGKSAADARAMILGSTFEGRTGFVDAAGGADALSQMAQYFAANFLTDAERLAPAKEALNTELNSLGLSIDLTRDQFRDLVQSFGEVGGVSEELFISLLKLAPEFVNVRNAQDALAESARNAAQINEEGVKALMQNAITTRQATLAAQRAELRAGMDDAFRSLQRAVDEERKSVGKHIDDIAKSIDRLKNLSGSLQSALGRMQISGNQAADRVAAQAQITTALAIAKASGTLPDAQSLSRALDVVAQPSEALFGSFVDYARDFARTAADISELDRLARDQLGAQDTELGLAQSQLTALDNILVAAQQEIDAINGVNTAIGSLASAISGFAAATAAVRQIEQDIKAAPTGLGSAVLGGAGNAAISGRDIALYINTSGATPDQILAKALETGVSAQQVVDAMGGMQGYTLDNIRGFVEQKGLIPGFAGGGFHRGGLRIVGENGPEIEYTGPSRIFSNEQSRELLDLSAVVAELKSLRTELAEIKASTSASAASNARTAELLDDVSAGGGPLLVTQVE